MKRNDLQYSSERGYIALMTVLIIAAVFTIIGISVTLLSIDEGQMGLGNQRSEQTLGLVEGCVDEALLKLNTSNTVPTSVVLPTITCTITVNSIAQGGGNWEFVVSGVANNYAQKIRVKATRTTTVKITSWQYE